MTVAEAGFEAHRQLSPEQLDEVAGLERRVVAADGGRLKLEWGSLRARSETAGVNDLLARHEGEMVGFAGLYQFGGGEIEIAGMVDPAYRGRGVGARLLDAALAEASARGRSEVLLVVPSGSPGGRALAARRAARLDHREHRLVLTGDPAGGPSDPRVSLRRAGGADAETVLGLLEGGFGFRPPGMAEQLDSDARTLLVLLDGEPVGTLRLTLEDGVGGVYGFVVRPDLQGRGIGRDVLRRACRWLRAQGAREVGLEVAVDNERALGLYLSTGFAAVAGEEYWRVEVA